MKNLYLFFTLLAGCLLPAQAILNSRLGRQTGGALVGALLSFLIGTVCLLLANSFINGSSLVSLKPGRTSPWYIWLGGVLGALFLSYITWVNQRQGVALTFILVVCGQIFMALLLDHFGWLGTVQRSITPMQLLGVVLILAGIFLVKK
ncbi:DMT family transporter [Pseudocnuella soli]|uniref:DMT family transporter n=1 Tax=Pseudocnuella soli TaxID=2502779 RepID=UPI00104AFA28|nr:DMT family transporter [Pseudocnuella soli]